MISETSAPRLLGAMYLIVILTSGLGGGLFISSTGSGGISDILTSVAAHSAMTRWSGLVNLGNSLGIVVLAVLLYTVLKRQDRILALVALCLWLGEALFYALAQIGAFALVPLSRDFIAAGAPALSYYQSLGAFLYQGLAKNSITLHMLFYCAGAILWYSMLLASRYVPRALSLFGLATVCVSLVGMAFQLFGYEVPILVSAPIGIFELLVGLWLLIRGIPGWPNSRPSSRKA